MARSSTSPATTAQPIAPALLPAAVPVPRLLLAWLTLGVGGTVLFLIVYLVEGATRPGYHALEQTISSLSFGPFGWIQRANYIFCGLSALGLAFVWRRILQGGPGARWYTVVHGIEGLGLAGLGIFIRDPVHTACLIIIVYTMSVSLFVMTWRFWRTPNWRGWALFSAACGLWPNLLMPLFGVALYSHTGLSPYAGLIERLDIRIIRGEARDTAAVLF